MFSLEKNMEISLLFDFYGQLLTANQHTAVELYYNDDLSLSEIAQDMQITRQGVRDLIKRSEQLLYGFEEKLGLCKRFNQVELIMRQIKDDANKIEQICNNPEIASVAKHITTLADNLQD